MSYKYIFSKLAQTDAVRALICEDDVVFFKEFATRLEKVLRFLRSSPLRWDVFCGLIADLNPSAEILDIIESEGIEYVFLNQMIGMVFNVYNRSVFAAIASWDERNRDVTTDTIDRYLGSHKGIVAVTTFPFLVSHDDDVPSSIWDPPHSYHKMLYRTQTCLASKINEFRRRRSVSHL